MEIARQIGMTEFFVFGQGIVMIVVGKTELPWFLLRMMMELTLSLLSILDWVPVYDLT